MSSIAFFILLLATFSYSAPIGQEYGNSTPDYEVTTDRQESIKIRSFVDDQSTNTPVIRDDRSLESIEVTTEDVTHSPRSFVNRTTPKMNVKRILEDSTPTIETKKKRLNKDSTESSEEFSTTPMIESKKKHVNKGSTESSEEFSTTPMIETKKERLNKDSTESSEEFTTTPIVETKKKRVNKDSTKVSSSESGETVSFPTSTDMNKKRDVLDGGRVQDEKRTVEEFMYTTMESSKEFNQRAIRPVESEEVESTKQVKKDVEPSSSVHAFGKYTGLLAEAQNSTSDYETTDRSVEQTTNESVTQPERLTKTVSIIPGRITNMKTAVINQSVQQAQLSQVENEPVVEKKESDN